MDLTTLRPTNTTAAAIGEARQRATAAQADVAGRIDAAKATRDGLLLDGDAKQLAAAEKALAEARGESERLDAILAELSNRHAAAEKAEALDELRASLQALRVAKDERVAWWRENGTQLQAVLRSGHELSEATDDARRRLHRSQQLLQERYPDADREVSAAFAGHVDVDETSDAWCYDQRVHDWADGQNLGEAVR